MSIEIKNGVNITGYIITNCIVGSVTLGGSASSEYPKYNGRYIVIDHPIYPDEE